MKRDEIQYFNAGLKFVIKRDWPTQEEFAKDVTSKVNLSKILGGNAGTSGSMRERLAQKAGMTVEEIIALGKGATHTRSTDTEPETIKPKVSGVPFNADTLSGMSSSELLSKISDYSADVTATIKALADERNRVFDEMRREQLVSNTLDEAIKVVNKKFNIGYCNRAYSEKYQQKKGDPCSKDECVSCKDKCLASDVFATGKPEHSVAIVNGSWFYTSAYPMRSSTGIIHNVVVISREIDTLLEKMREMGWECTFKGKV